MEMPELFGQLQGMMQSAATMGVVDKMIAAYDNFAVAAMQSILATSSVQMTPEETAVISWQFADAMMIERRKRGLGAPGSGSDGGEGV